ncbi:hypothetical protein FOCC_FOCC017418, partial [Frankliniella occidentalis]
MFPRAEIHRFNDVKNDVPAPGAYDPKFDDMKIKGVGMDKMTDRFTKPKHTANDCALQRSASLNTLPVCIPPMRKKSVKFSQAFRDSSLEEQLHAANCKLLDSESKCKQLENDIAVDREAIARVELEKSDLTKEVDRLMEEIAEQKSHLANLTESFNIADANLAERKAAVSELEQTKTELLLEMEILKERVEQNKSEMEMSVRRCLELEGCIAEAKAENGKLVEIRLSLSNEVADLGERLNIKVIDLEEKLASVTSELELSQLKCQSLEGVVEQCQKKLLETENEKSKLAAQVLELAYKLEQQVLDERKTNKTLQEEIDDEQEQHQRQIQAQSVKITELDAEVQKQSDLAQFLLTRVEENRKEVEKMEEEKMVLQNEISSLKMQNKKMIQWENEESLQKAKKVESQKEEILALTEQVEKIKLDVEREKTIGREREEALTEEISSLKISLGAKTQEVGTVKGRLQLLESELEQTTRRKDTYLAVLGELQQEIIQSQSKMSSLEDDLKSTQQKPHERESHFNVPPSEEGVDAAAAAETGTLTPRPQRRRNVRA